MIKKILSATINADHPQLGMEDAFRAIYGAENVRVYDYLKRFRETNNKGIVNEEFARACAEFKPDWLWMQLQMTNVITPQTIEHIRGILPGCVISHWMGDLRSSVSPDLAALSCATDVTLISNAGQLDKFRELGAKVVEYCQIGLDWKEDVEGIPEWTPPFRVPPVVFCGNYYGSTFPGSAQRIEGVKALRAAGIDVGVLGTGWPGDIPVIGQCHVKQQHHVWKRAVVAININNFNDVLRYYSDRQIIAMASGTPLVCAYIPGLEEEFQNDVHCLWFKTPQELVDHVKRLLADEALRTRIGEAGRAEVLRAHTWEARFREWGPRMEELQKKKLA